MPQHSLIFLETGGVLADIVKLWTPNKRVRPTVIISVSTGQFELLNPLQNGSTKAQNLTIYKSIQQLPIFLH